MYPHLPLRPGEPRPRNAPASGSEGLARLEDRPVDLTQQLIRVITVVGQQFGFSPARLHGDATPFSGTRCRLGLQQHPPAFVPVGAMLCQVMVVPRLVGVSAADHLAAEVQQHRETVLQFDRAAAQIQGLADTADATGHEDRGFVRHGLEDQVG